jgi:beta-fructofuranosidase
MWECPDIFPLGDRHVLQFSPMGLGDQKTAALVGEMDYAGCRFSWSKMGEVDAGFDFYGPQSTAGPDGQRVVVGWQNAWDWMPWFSGFGPAAMENWCGCMSLPRAVSLGADGTPRYWPVAGLESLRGEACDFGEQTLSAGERFPLLVGDNIHFELELTVDLGRTRASLVELRLRESAHEETLVRIDLALGALSVDRSRSDLSLKGVITRPLAARRGGADSLTLRLFADTSSVEVFADEGRVCMDCAIFPERSSTGLSVQAVDGTAVFSARGWAMRPAASSLAWE